MKNTAASPAAPASPPNHSRVRQGSDGPGLFEGLEVLQKVCGLLKGEAVQEALGYR